MSDKQNWRDRWEEKDRDGAKVVDVWERDGQLVAYMWETPGGVKVSPEVNCLIPRKPAPVVVPWEPDEVPVGAVVRHKDKGTVHIIIGRRIDDRVVAFEVGGYGAALLDVLHKCFVLHQPGVQTEQCQPCGKVVGE